METQNDTRVEPPETEQPKRGRGRPPGAKNLRSRDAAKRLAMLGFDPISEMIKLYDKTLVLIELEKRKSKPSTVALAAFNATAQKCINDLMRYGYARTSETSVVETVQLPPMQVHLTTPGATTPIMATGVREEGSPEDDDEDFDDFDRPEPVVPDSPAYMKDEEEDE